MEKQFTVHIQNWRINGKFFITENRSGKTVGLFFGAARKRMLDLLKNDPNAGEAFEFVFEVPGESNPIPTFVERYEIFYREPGGFGMRTVLTEKGCLRKSLEVGGDHQKYKITPYFPMDYL